MFIKGYIFSNFAILSFLSFLISILVLVISLINQSTSANLLIDAPKRCVHSKTDSLIPAYVDYPIFPFLSLHPLKRGSNHYFRLVCEITKINIDSVTTFNINIEIIKKQFL